MNKNNTVSKFDRKDIIIPLIGFSLLVLIKLLFTITYRELPIIADEYTYAYYGKNLSEFHSYRGYQYPLFYPLILAQAYWFGKANVFMTMKVINVIWSSLTVVFTYFIARSFMDWKKSIVPMIFSMIIPFQFTYSMLLLSENVYFPLLLLSILMIVRNNKHQYVDSFLYGALIGILFLTRFITLIMMPVFILAWLMKKLDQKTSFINIIMQGIMMIVTAVVMYMPFFAVQLKKGYPVKFLLGFSIASKTNKEQLTMGRMGMVAVLYFCFMVIAAAPVITYMVKSFWAIEFKNLFGKFNRLWIMSWGLFGTSFVAVVRHSWRASYNYPEFERIKGRYLIYFPLIFAILATVIMLEKKTKIKNKVVNIVICYILPAITFAFAYGVIAKGFLYKLDGGRLLTNLEAIDGYKALLGGTGFLVSVLILNLVGQVAFDYGDEILARLKGIKTEHITVAIPVILSVSLLVCGFAGNGKLNSYLKEQNDQEKNTKVAFAYKMDNVIEKMHETHYSRIIIVPDSMMYNVFLTKYFKFKYNDKVLLTNTYKKYKDQTIYVFTMNPDKYKEITIEKVDSFEHVDGSSKGTYHIILVDKNKLETIQN
ncbi:MAG: hypothetical protein IKN54_04780 [Lachnospiraceae bacterium]|nr:hypothetical protein [Lachnospiraceae bacterium]